METTTLHAFLAETETTRDVNALLARGDRARYAPVRLDAATGDHGLVFEADGRFIAIQAAGLDRAGAEHLADMLAQNADLARCRREAEAEAVTERTVASVLGQIEARLRDELRHGAAPGRQELAEDIGRLARDILGRDLEHAAQDRARHRLGRQAVAP